jgi:biopolymer transport protein ExbD
MTKPNINVTPLIDVLLVLLIIFMVISPLKPTDIKARIPADPEQEPREKPDPLTLVAAINSDSSLSLNHDNEVGSVQRPEKLIARLRETLSERGKNQVYSEGSGSKADLTEDEKIEKSVFIKTPRAQSYGDVVKVIDAVKQAGARPLGLQIDDLQ